MEAKARAQPSKPPEGAKQKSAVISENWRTKKKVAFEEEDDEDDTTQPVPEKRVRETEKAREEARYPRTEMPYKSVKPLNTGARTQPVLNKERSQGNVGSNPGDKSYRIRAPIQRDGVTEEVMDHIHNTEVTIKLGDLYGLSKDLREGERIKLTKVRQPVSPKAPEVATLHTEEVPLPTEEILDLPLGHDALDIEELPQVGVFVTSQVMDNIPIGSVVAQDPYLQYLESLGEEESPKQIYVARESAPLRVTYPVINNRDSVESVLDSGSQIVSMALATAKEMGLIWNPRLQIYMQSANGSMEKSLGMARNVPFKWGAMTIYLQVHIINSPAYKVLLGRPFDILTTSQIENSADGGQVVTMTDPNTGRVYAVPTFDRGHVRGNPSNTGTTVEVLDQGNRPKPAAFLNKGFRNSSRS